MKKSEFKKRAKLQKLFDKAWKNRDKTNPIYQRALVYRMGKKIIHDFIFGK